jgi:nitrogen fixation protein NifU and related proteins
MSSLDALYRDVVMDHQRHPRGARPLVRPGVHAEGVNPSCGDEVRLELEVAEGRIRDASVQTRGCAVSTASGSMLAELIRGRTVDEARRIATVFRSVMHGEAPPTEVDLGDLEALTGVRKFPVRIKCALRPWVTLLDAVLAQEQGRAAAPPTTEDGREPEETRGSSVP